MGCHHSSAGKDTGAFTSEQKRLIVESWKEVHIDLERMGMILFMGMFDTHPETRPFFGFTESAENDDPKTSQRLREHGLRFMSLVKKLLTYIDDNERFDNMLLDLGRRHRNYKADINLVDVFGEQFILAIRPTLRHTWNPQIEESWTQLFRYIAFMMKRGLSEPVKEA
ncbi:neuroglobin-like [Glandiceps talaboti]